VTACGPLQGRLIVRYDVSSRDAVRLDPQPYRAVSLSKKWESVATMYKDAWVLLAAVWHGLLPCPERSKDSGRGGAASSRSILLARPLAGQTGILVYRGWAQSRFEQADNSGSVHRPAEPCGYGIRRWSRFQSATEHGLLQDGRRLRSGHSGQNNLSGQPCLLQLCGEAMVPAITFQR